MPHEILNLKKLFLEVVLNSVPDWLYNYFVWAHVAAFPLAYSYSVVFYGNIYEVNTGLFKMNYKL